MANSDVVQHNIEMVKRHFANEVAGDSDAVLDEMTDDCHYYMIPVIDEKIDDKNTIRAIHQGLNDAFTDMYIDVEAICATEDMVAAQTVLGGKQTGEWDGIPPTGKEIRLSTAAIFHIRDGKIVSESIYFDRREILRQLGIEEKLML